MDLERDVVISLKEFDRSQLPADQQDLDDFDFRFAVVDYLKAKYRDLGHHVEVRADLEKVVISPQANEDNILKAFNAGNLQYGIELCDELLGQDPDNGLALYNSAMALSDLNQLDKAIERLQHLIDVEGRSTGANVYVALGVAFARQSEPQKGIRAFEHALEIEPANQYALRNVASLYSSEGMNDKALDIYKNLAPMYPQDAATQLGYGEALRKAGRNEEASELFDFVIATAPGTLQAQQAKEGKIAIFSARNDQKKQEADGLRMDAVQFMQEALGTYDSLSENQAKALFVEVAMQGQSGYDTGSSELKYTLKTMPGKHYSGFQLVCMMYVGSIRVMGSDGSEMGIDLKDEFIAAEKIHNLSR
ncbi:tetratricopeptide repeat protein [Endozoicomonas sp. ISHI1]|uniref:tetratricopeptide repeat protein n=1 Tax=Endozoicomonas sp. ISHI1 TaxID=2825882 RepID=UPI002148B137|nr:tetratricopeptide repeat protein [Endozoicomonas sp. ISHI1]